MNKFHRIIEKTSCLLDDIAGWGVVVTMVLVVVNIILRSVFNRPIKGVYEYTGYFTAVVIGFAIAKCALDKAHIAVDFFIEKLNSKFQMAVDTVLTAITMVFLAFAGIQVLLYGINVFKIGEVSQTAHIPFYPFILMVSAGIFALCLVEASKLIKGVAKK